MRAPPTRSMERRDRQRGAALLLVIWVVALLSLLAATALQITSVAGHTSQALLERARMEAAADGAVNLALLSMIDPDKDARWPVNGSPRTLELGGYKVTIATADEAGKVDVNRAPIKLLKALMQFRGVQPNSADAWVRTISSHRGDVGGGNGSGSFPAESRGTTFRNVDEVVALASGPQVTTDCMRSDLTVYTGMESVNQRYASRSLQLAMLNQTSPAASLANVDASLESDSLAGRLFSFRASTSSDLGGFTRRAVVRLTGDPARPVLVSYWTTDTSTECPSTGSERPTR